MNIPKWAVIAFAIPTGFMIFILSLVTYVSIQDVNLVADDYYKKGLDYQSRIDQAENVNSLLGGIEIKQRTENNSIEINIPSAAGIKEIKGSIRFIRPSNANLDQTFQLSIDSSGMQTIDISQLARGLWRLEIQWDMNNIPYFKENRIVIP